jgi:hypothetical protein
MRLENSRVKTNQISYYGESNTVLLQPFLSQDFAVRCVRRNRPFTLDRLCYRYTSKEASLDFNIDNAQTCEENNCSIQPIWRRW